MNNIRKVLRAKHWQIFSILMGISFIQGSSQGSSSAISTIFYILYIVIYIGWLLVLGMGLKSMRLNVAMNYALFLATGIALITVVVSVKILETMGLLNNFENDAIAIPMLVLILTSLIILCSFIAKNLKINEKGEDIDINDYFGDILRLIFWPIGIWSIQPRINRLANKLASH